MKKNIGKFILQEIKKNKFSQDKTKKENKILYENCISFLIEGKPATGKTYFFENEFIKYDEIKEYELFKFNCFDLQENFEEKMLEQIIKDKGTLRKNSLKWWRKLAIKQLRFWNSFWRIVFLPILLGFILPTLMSLLFEANSKDKKLFWWMIGVTISIFVMVSLIGIYCLIINFLFLKMDTRSSLNKILKKNKKYIYIFDDLDRVENLKKRDYILKEINLLKIYLNENKIGEQNIFITITNIENKIEKEKNNPFAHFKNTISEPTDAAIRKSTESLLFALYDMFEQKNNSQKTKITEKFYDFYLSIEESKWQKQDTIYSFFENSIENKENIIFFKNLIDKNITLLLDEYNLRNLNRMIEIINNLIKFFNQSKYLIKRFFPSYLEKSFYFSLIFAFFPQEFWNFIQNSRKDFSKFSLKYFDKKIEFDITTSEMFILFQFLTVETKNEDYDNIPINELIKIVENFNEDEIYVYEILNACGKNLLSKATFKIFLQPLLNSFNFKKIVNIDDLYQLQTTYHVEELIWNQIIKSQNFQFDLTEKVNIINLNFSFLKKEILVNQILLLKFIWSNISIISEIELGQETIDEKIKILNTQPVGVFDFLGNIRLISKSSMFFNEETFELMPQSNEHYNYNFLFTYLEYLKKKNTHYDIISKSLFIIFNLNSSFDTYEKNFNYLYLSLLLKEANDQNLNSYIVCLLNKKEIINILNQELERQGNGHHIINENFMKHLKWLLNLNLNLIE